MTPIDSFLSNLSKKMDGFLGGEGSEFERRTIEPSPGDTFDIYYREGRGERYYYIAHDYIIPLHRIVDGNLQEFSGYRGFNHDVLSWDSIVGAVEESDDPDKVYLELVSTATSSKSPLTTAINKLNEWAMRNPNQQESIMLLNVVEKLRGM